MPSVSKWGHLGLQLKTLAIMENWGEVLMSEQLVSMFYKLVKSKCNNFNNNAGNVMVAPVGGFEVNITSDLIGLHWK